jgi:diaminohydroxyphosphoribosylaminopyrimidine deaminase/5-amino-6-(5-phosphoribosylamino)uracil reductase
MISEEGYMREALGLAAKGLGRTSPNPAVGCVIVKGGKIVGRGWHKKAGEPHAEVIALKAAGKKAKGATVYVTLEPCCCFGKTPPCTDALIKAGVKSVVAAMEDPNPRVCGSGVDALKKAGIKVKIGLLEDEAFQLNEAFAKHITTGMPFVIAKAALSADGKMAAGDSTSKWITCEAARKRAHELRNLVDAVMVGADTVIKDDPELTCRVPGGRNPVRIVIDSQLRTPPGAKIFNSAAKTILATVGDAHMGKAEALEDKGARVVFAGNSGLVDLRRLMKELGGMGITSVMIEGGGKVLGSAFDAGVVDKIMFFIAPKIIGGRGLTIRSDSVGSIAEALQLENVSFEKVGEDFLLTAYVKKGALK